MNYELINNRIISLAKHKGITKTAALVESGAGKDFTVTIKNGSEPSISKFRKLADYLETTTAYLLGETDNPRPLPKSLTDAIMPYVPENMTPIPVIGSVSAGIGCLAEMDIESYEFVDSSNLNSTYEHVYVKVKGDSMEPLLLEGDLVLVRVQDYAETGDYVVVIINGDEGVVKRIEINKTNIILHSENPYYPPRKFDKKAMNDVRIFGIVIESKRKFR